MNALEIVKQAYVYLNEKDIPNYFSLMSPNVEFYQTEEFPGLVNIVALMRAKFSSPNILH
jgi:hypothetical protein